MSGWTRGAAGAGSVAAVFLALVVGDAGLFRQALAASPRSDPVTMWVRYPPVPTKLDATAELGRRIFFDKSLSASGKMACASCHDPDHAYGPPDGLPVQPGGALRDKFGTRAVPSLRYLSFTPKFSRHLAQPSPDGVEDEGPAGGFTRDGSAQSLREQASMPLLNPFEMANPDVASVNAKLRQAAWARDFQSVFGAHVFDDPAAAVANVGAALEAFETQDPSFHPYTSKFDAAMSGNATFTAAEWRGYRVFNDSSKGNCAKCHVDMPGPGGRPAQFTDYGHVAIGVPRNPAIAANRDPLFFDLGLCGPFRKDLAAEGSLCGMFKTPTLRNAATRRVFFHNGFAHTLTQAVRFYAERDPAPSKWYSTTHGKVVAFDDLPARYRANIDRIDVPFNQPKGAAPLLKEADVADLVAFIKTLDDSYSSVAGGKPRPPPSSTNLHKASGYSAPSASRD